MKEEIHELNSPLMNDINTNSNVNAQEILNENDNENEIPQIRGSEEKILHLKRGYEVWINICKLFGLCVIIFVTCLTVILVFDSYYILYLFVAIASLGILLFCICHLL